MSGLPVPSDGDLSPGGADGQTRGPDQRLGRAQRLTRSTDFDDTYSQQRKWVGRFMVLWLRSSDDASWRLGVVSSRKVGGAVQRVRARRLLREVFRRHRYQLQGRFDVVLVARASILTAAWTAIESEFLTLVQKAGVYTPQ
jgi:ribonuclease P protein component